MRKRSGRIGDVIFIVLCIITVVVSILLPIYCTLDRASDDTSEESIDKIVMDKADSTDDIYETSASGNKETEPQKTSASVTDTSEPENNIYDTRCPEDLSYVAWYYGEGSDNHDEALVIEDGNGDFYIPRSSNYEKWLADHIDNCPYSSHDGPDYRIPDWLYQKLLDSKSDDGI